MRFRSIADESEIERLVSLGMKRDVLTYWVTTGLERGESRLEWCRTACSDEGELLAAQVFDSWSGDGDPGEVPTFVQLLGHADEAAATALLRHDLKAFDAEVVAASVIIDADASPELRTLGEGQREVLVQVGFRSEVDRVRLLWPDGAATPRPEGRLTFRPATTFPDAGLVEIFAAVGDGSVDHNQRAVRAEVGREAEAAKRLGQARHRDYGEDWFVAGVNPTGESVGYVQSAMVPGDRAILAELGVVESHRGRGYAAELLAHGTAILLDAGIDKITSDTDQENRAMRAAFARVGYVEFATRHDFRWIRTRTTG